jgi:hypothetical protein
MFPVSNQALSQALLILRTLFSTVCVYRSVRQADTDPGACSEGPATKTSMLLNLNRIKYLSQHKQACAHSFPQKVCKDEAADKPMLPKSAIKRGDAPLGCE